MDYHIRDTDGELVGVDDGVEYTIPCDPGNAHYLAFLRSQKPKSELIKALIKDDKAIADHHADALNAERAAIEKASA